MNHSFILVLTDEDLEIMKQARRKRIQEVTKGDVDQYQMDSVNCILDSLHYGVQDDDNTWVTQLRHLKITQISSF